MPCTRPVKGYRATGGRIVANKARGFSDLPVTRPCGGCVNCRLEYSRQWAMRMMHESSLYEDNCFLTLTYRNEDLPENMSLDKEHGVLFMKRLRKKYTGRKIRFFWVGEYGDTTNRPHYHAIIFNLDFADKKYLKTTESRSKLYTSKQLDALWGLGDCYIGNVTFESAAYCGRYVMKKLTGARKSEYGSRVPEYSIPSRRPGIGAPWLEKWKTDVFPNDFCVINGKKVKVPKRYDAWMMNKETKEGKWVTDKRDGLTYFMPSVKRTKMEKLKGKRVRSALKHSENQTRERLDVIEELATRRLERLARN